MKSEHNSSDLSCVAAEAFSIIILIEACKSLVLSFFPFSCSFNSLTAKSILAGEKLVATYSFST